MKITKENIHMFLPIKANDRRGNLHIISGALDGELYVKDHKAEYCRIKFEDWDFSKSLKDYSELKEEDWIEVFQAGGLYGKIEISSTMVECINEGAFDFIDHNFIGGYVSQLEAFRVLIEKRKR